MAHFVAGFKTWKVYCKRNYKKRFLMIQYKYIMIRDIKCNRCEARVRHTKTNVLILDHVSSHIKDAIANYKFQEKVAIPNYSCLVCNDKFQKELKTLKIEREEVSKNEGSKEQLKIIEKKEKKIKEKIKQNEISSSAVRIIRNHQKWLYLEFAGSHVLKKIKDKNHLKFLDKESESLLGEAEKFILRSRDAKFLIKFPKETENRNNHGFKELVTEIIMTDIASCFTKAAKCWLVIYKDRISLCSTIFTFFKNSKYDYRLIHGLEIFQDSGEETPPKHRKEQRQFYTIEKIEESIEKYLKKQSITLMKRKKNMDNFHLMLLVDCLLGHQDRHHENWGLVLKKQSNETKDIYFTPLFDTGHGLFWNENIYELIFKYEDRKNLLKYVENSKPLLTVQNNLNESHFSVVQYIRKNNPVLFKHFVHRLNLLDIENLTKKYRNLISPIRIVRISQVLKIRKNKILGL